MDKKNLLLSIGKLFCLRSVLYNSFDTTPLGVTLNPTQIQVLMFTWLYPEPTMLFLSREVGIEKGSLTSVTDTLEALGLVRRVRHANDRRSFIVRPTPEGVEMAEKLAKMFDSHLDSMFDVLSENDRKDFVQSASTLSRLVSLIG